MEDSGPFFAVVITASLVLAAVWGAGAKWEENRWESDLVDRPEAIAAIRSKVLAERAVKEATK